MPRLTDAIIEYLVPRETPPFNLVPHGVPDEVMRAGRERRGRDRLIFLWCTAFQAVIENNRWDKKFAGFQFATYGFIPIIQGLQVPDGIRFFESYVFGAALQLEEAESSPTQEIFPIQEGNVSVPCVLNRGPIKTHQRHLLPFPSNPLGTGACWARSRKQSILPAADGVLTAAHIVSHIHRLKTPVLMSDGTYWHLGDRGNSKVDAALIVKSGCIPLTTKVLAVERIPIQGEDIEFYGITSGRIITAKVTRSHVHPTTLSDQFTMVVFFDDWGEEGDSGALVLNIGSGAGVGIYSGVSVKSNEGYAQALCQAQDVLEVELFID